MCGGLKGEAGLDAIKPDQFNICDMVVSKGGESITHSLDHQTSKETNKMTSQS